MQIPAELTAIEGFQITSLGGMSPLVAEGTILGLPFYLHYRGGEISLAVGHYVLTAPLYRATMEHGEGYQAWFDTDADFALVMKQLIAKLSRAARLWHFKGIETVGPKQGQPTTFAAWGMTPNEAWERMHQPLEYVTTKGFSPEVQAQWIADRQMEPQTITIDDRVWPDPEPDFAALVSTAQSV